MFLDYSSIKRRGNGWMKYACKYIPERLFFSTLLNYIALNMAFVHQIAGLYEKREKAVLTTM